MLDMSYDTRLPDQFIAFFELRTNEGVVNRAPRFESHGFYNLICGCLRTERWRETGMRMPKITADPHMMSAMYHEGQLIRDQNILPQYFTTTFCIPRATGDMRIVYDAQVCHTGYSVHIGSRNVGNLPVFLFQLSATEYLMDLDPPYVNCPMPRVDWINHLLMIRRNLNDEDTTAAAAGGGGGGGSSSSQRQSQRRRRAREYDEIDDEDTRDGWGSSAAGGGYGGGGGAAAGGGGGANPYNNYHIPNMNEIQDIYFPASVSSAAAAAAAAGGGPAAAPRAPAAAGEQRPLEGFVAEALVREAMRTAMTCSISMEPIKGSGCVVTNCYHIFQKESLETWKESHNDCPVCRKALVYRDVTLEGAAASHATVLEGGGGASITA